MTFAFIAGHRHIWPVSWLCKVLEVSHSGFHASLGRPASAHATRDAQLVTAIDKSFKTSDRTYGAASGATCSRMGLPADCTGSNG